MAKILRPELASKPLNVNRITLADMLQYDALILGTQTYGEGILSGTSTGVEAGSWEEFLPQLAEADLSGKVIALYGLGDQEKYPEYFADALMLLYNPLKQQGATMIGEWSTEGYEFERSEAVVDGKFVGLVIDHCTQNPLTDERLRGWLELVRPMLMQSFEISSLSRRAKQR